jgi:hypothetical protein
MTPVIERVYGQEELPVFGETQGVLQGMGPARPASPEERGLHPVRRKDEELA